MADIGTALSNPDGIYQMFSGSLSENGMLPLNLPPEGKEGDPVILKTIRTRTSIWPSGEFATRFPCCPERLHDPCCCCSWDARQNDLFALKHIRELPERHDNLVRLLGFGSSVNQKKMVIVHYAVLEFGGSRTLQDLASTKDVLGPPTLKRFACQISSAMHFLHSYGVVHRNLCARNVLVSSDNATKVTGFTFSSVLGRAQFVPLDIQNEECRYHLGDKAYMSPEILRDGLSRKADPAEDVWSFGVLLFYLASGVLCFGDHNTSAIFGQQMLFLPQGCECVVQSAACAKHRSFRNAKRTPFHLVLLQIRTKFSAISDIVEHALRVCPLSRWTMHDAHRCLNRKDQTFDDLVNMLACDEFLSE